jgi:antitoxin component YwqK of YwqJK toxin-antitoxin module
MSDDVRANYDDLELDDQLALRDGVPFTGIVYSKRPDGSLESEGFYRDGLPDGKQEQYYPGGQVEQRWIAVRGKGSSEVRTWHRNGRLRSVATYVDQRLTGAQAWDDGGEPIEFGTLGQGNGFGEAKPGAVP